MISFKKSYAEQLLQLALALSLLHVDPESYLGRGWESQLELRNGDGWQLEMLRAVPISDYPYANRKAMMPLIEDLIRFDRQTNLNDVTAYLLNVQDGGSNQTVSSQELDSSGGGGGAVSVEPPPVNNNSSSSVGLQEIDLFLNSEHFLEHESITDLNLADLSEYGDIPLAYFPYYGLPLKDEPPEAFPPIDFNLEMNQASTSSIAGLRSRSDGTGTVVTWSEISNTTREIKNEEDDKKNRVFVKQETDFLKSTDVINEKNQASTSANEGQAETKINVKKEPGTEDGEEEFESNVELTEEESEIVEVLWKQDVDLGYSLSPPKLISTDAGTSTSTKNSDDEVEKLKALQELKEDKPKDDTEKQDELDDEWAGIPFRIDNETGEYIRLPLQLDEILQDVLQLADHLTTEDPEEPENKERKSDSSPPSKKNSEKSKKDGGSNTSDGCSATVEPPQSEVEISSLPSPLFDLDDASELDDLDMMIQSAGPFQHHRPGQNYATNSAFRQSGFHHHQSRVPLSRGVSMEQRLQDIASLFNPIPGMGVGMGVGDMSPYSHYPTHYPYQSAPGIPQHSQFPHPPHPVLHNASLADLGATQPHYGHNLGSAVTSSMHLTNSSHEADSGAAGYKMEHDMMYYSNTSSELNHTTDGFINSFLNDEDLQLMDMGVNEGFCTMRMLEGNATSNNSSVLGSSSGGGSHAGHLISSMPSSLGTMTSEGITAGGDRLDASSDSAVSSMGSERVPSLSDGEWGDAGSDSAQEFHQGKYGGPYDYSYSSRLGDTSRQPVAQKKHQMFGKRYFQEQPNMPLSQAQSAAQPPDHLATPVKYEYEPYGLHQNPSAVGHNMEGAVGPIINKNHVPLMTNSEMKYACSLDFSARPPRSHDLISHNHTYTLPQGSGSTPRPQIRDKKQKKAEDEHLTRDEKRARSLNIPIAVHDIINLPMDEFNERLSKYDLTENQLSLIRDIRRRGKNKVAAQNCRKRKLDQILSLEDEVREVRRRKDRLYQDREVILAERKRIANKFAALHRHVFQYLRDADGNPCSPSEYSLQQAADGSVYLLRRENNKPDGSGNSSGSNHTGNTNGHHQHSTQGPSPPSHHQKE